MEREADFFEQLAEDGRPALMLFAVGLLISGAFAGSLMATAVLYLWLAVFPLRNGERWAWWAFALSGIRRVRRRGSRLHGIDAGDAAGGESAAGPAHRA